MTDTIHILDDALDKVTNALDARQQKLISALNRKHAEDQSEANALIAALALRVEQLEKEISDRWGSKDPESSMQRQLSRHADHLAKLQSEVAKLKAAIAR